jgi:hypothetical protein
MQIHSSQPQISRHAIERYQQRVSCVAPAEAAQLLAEFATHATRRPTPRRWTNVPPGPGVLFLYPHANSGICLLMKGETIVTVFSRDVCRTWRGQGHGTGARQVVQSAMSPDVARDVMGFSVLAE